MAQLILDSGALVNVPSGSENNIPLTLACWKGKCLTKWGCVIFCCDKFIVFLLPVGKNKFFIVHLPYTLCIMACSRSGPGNESHQNKAGGLTLNLFLQFCVLFQVKIILKDI